MLGAIAGDIIGSVYEFENIKTTKFPLFRKDCFFTDDTVLTVALADSILNGYNFTEAMLAYYRNYPSAGYGGRFHKWAKSADPQPYNSCGNGAAMRISPAGWAYATLEETIHQAEKFTAITHDHPEGVKGGCSVAATIFLARSGSSKENIRNFVEDRFGYDLSQNCDQIRRDYRFDETSQGTVPQAIIAFLESSNFESAIRLAVSLGGDTDTLACITGSIAEAFYGGAPHRISKKVMGCLDKKLTAVTNEFVTRFVTVPERKWYHELLP